MIGLKQVVLFSLVFLMCEKASAFPEMVRLGFTNCNACHVNPNGGGILNPSGRAASAGLLSHQFLPGEERFLYGLTDDPKLNWLNLGGDLRFLQVNRETSQTRQGRFIVMQTDLEGAVEYHRVTLVATAGISSLTSPPYLRNAQFTSRRHYALFRPAIDERLILRAGRFYLPFGIRQPEHEIATKQGLGWNVNSETYNVEAAWTQGTFDSFLAINFGNLEDRKPGSERGVASRTRFYFNGKTQAGLSYYYGSSAKGHRHVYGPLLVTALTSKSYLLTELDFQHASFHNKITGDREYNAGLASYSRLGYELTRGLFALATESCQKKDFRERKSLSLSLGLGAQYFPRPHWEFTLMAERRRQAITEKQDTLAWLLMHFYL